MRIEFIVKDGQPRIEIDLSEVQEQLVRIDQTMKDVQGKVKRIEEATNELGSAARQWWNTVIGK